MSAIAARRLAAVVAAKAAAATGAGPNEMMATVAALHEEQDGVERAFGELLAWLALGDMARTAMRRALGAAPPETIDMVLLPHEYIVTAPLRRWCVSAVVARPGGRPW